MEVFFIRKNEQFLKKGVFSLNNMGKSCKVALVTYSDIAMPEMDSCVRNMCEHIFLTGNMIAIDYGKYEQHFVLHHAMFSDIHLTG